MYFLHGRFSTKAGQAKALANILIEASRLVSTAKGCRLYVIGKDPQNPDSVHVTEIWDSKEDHDNSLQVEGVRELIAKAMPLLDGPPKRGQELVILGGHGINAPST